MCGPDWNDRGSRAYREAYVTATITVHARIHACDADDPDLVAEAISIALADDRYEIDGWEVDVGDWAYDD